MAWHKALAEAGLAGLEPWEAARRGDASSRISEYARPT